MFTISGQQKIIRSRQLYDAGRIVDIGSVTKEERKGRLLFTIDTHIFFNHVIDSHLSAISPDAK